jgi:hypothetical protein
MLRFMLIAALATGGQEFLPSYALPPIPLLTEVSMAGPSWISIESPPNPYNPDTRGALLVVRVYHHNQTAFYPLSGTAEGLIAGKRQSVALSFVQTSTPGMYALKFTRPVPGAWLLMIHIGDNPEHNEGTAMVTLDSSGQVANVQVPTEQKGEYSFPRPVTEEEVATRLKSLAGA